MPLICAEILTLGTLGQHSPAKGAVAWWTSCWTGNKSCFLWISFMISLTDWNSHVWAGVREYNDYERVPLMTCAWWWLVWWDLLLCMVSVTGFWWFHRTHHSQTSSLAMSFFQRLFPSCCGAVSRCSSCEQPVLAQRHAKHQAPIEDLSPAGSPSCGDAE